MRGLRVLALCLATPAAPAAAQQDAIAVPSGQVLWFQELIWEAPGPAGATARFRFVAPGIARDGGGVDFETADADMAFLCESYAIPRLEEAGTPAALVIVSLSDRPVTFGHAAPEATQYFEAYRPENGRCVWEGF